MHVNKHVFENNWEQIRAQSKVWWGLFSGEDLNLEANSPSSELMLESLDRQASAKVSNARKNRTKKSSL